MSQKFYGSICVTDLIEHLKSKHSAFSKSDKNKKVYARVDVWINDKEDEHGNVLGIQIIPNKDKKDIEKKWYVGNCKKAEFEQTPANKKDVSDLTGAVDSFMGADHIKEPIDDLPF